MNKTLHVLTSAIISDNRYKHCVLSNAGLSSALTETGICTTIKYLAKFYFQFHPLLSTRWALFNFTARRNARNLQALY